MSSLVDQNPSNLIMVVYAKLAGSNVIFCVLTSKRTQINSSRIRFLPVNTSI